MRRSKTATRGSAIAWAMVVIMVLMILVSAVLSLSLGYVTRSMKNNEQRQAYFTARSAALTAASEVCKGTDSAPSALLPPDETGGSNEYTVHFKDDADDHAQRMGEAKVTVQRFDADNGLITAESDVNGRTETVRLRIYRTKKGQWRADRFLDAGEPDKPSSDSEAP